MSETNGNIPNRKVTGKALFPMGIVVGSPGAAEVMRKHDLHPLVIVARHVSGDWGQVDLDDAAANEFALLAGERIMSVYRYGPEDDDVLWVITEADRRATTILTPDEY